MGKITGFKEFKRKDPEKREKAERLSDFEPVYKPSSLPMFKEQSARCMDCAIAFCHKGCPLGNRIPEWIHFSYKDHWKEAIASLEETNNFPELTGWLCPAPCEDVCVLGLIDEPVTIKEIEKKISMRALEEGWIKPRPPEVRTGKTVAVVGSGPAGLAAAQQLNRAGHLVTVFERDDKPGGLIRYGIPDFKMDKELLDKRLLLLEQEGICFKTNCNIGESITLEELKKSFDAVVLACGALKEKGLQIEGRELSGVLLAMDYLTRQNRALAGEILHSDYNASGKKVVVIGGGDTGADCVGTALRQGAHSVIQLQYHNAPPIKRDAVNNPWPESPNVLRDSFVYQEGGVRLFNRLSKAFLGREGRVVGLKLVQTNEYIKDGKLIVEEVPGTEEVLEADLILLATGFFGPDCTHILSEARFEQDRFGNIITGSSGMTHIPGIFATGDMSRGASLVVWAIADGRNTARAVDCYLMGSSDLPSVY